MKIFITGSEGFIGSHLTEKLASIGHKLTCLVNYNFKSDLGWLSYIDKSYSKNIKIIHGDVRDYNFIKNIIQKNDIVFNLAALIGIPYSYTAVNSYLATNVEGTINILNACKESKISRLIHTSTSEVYGTAQYLPINEKHPLNPQSPYAASKVSADQFCISYYRSFNLPITIIRPFNTFGPRQSLRAVIPTIILQALSNNKKIYLGNIQTYRDFCYIDDTVNGFVSILKKYNTKKLNGEIFNIGSGYKISIENIAKIILKKTNSLSKIEYQKFRTRSAMSEVHVLQSDSSKAINTLNWSPKFSGKQGLITAIENTIDWYQHNYNKFSEDISKFYY